jgi:hypothetical protein
MQAFHMCWTILAARIYMDIGRWQPSKFFMKELLLLFDICIWYNQLPSIFIRSKYIKFVKLQLSTNLYLVTYIEDTDEIMNRPSVPIESLSTADDIVSLAIPPTTIPVIEFDEGLDFIDKLVQVNRIFSLAAKGEDYYKSVYSTNGSHIFFEPDLEIYSFICPTLHKYNFYFPRDIEYNFWKLEHTLLKIKIKNYHF